MSYRIVLLGDSVLEKFSHTELKNYTIFSGLDTVQSLDTLLKDSPAEFFPKTSDKSLIYVLSFGSKDVALQTPLNIFRRCVERFLEKLSSAALDYNVEIEITYIKPLITKKMDRDLQNRIAEYTGLSYSTLLSYFPRTILTSIDSREANMSATIKCLLKKLTKKVDASPADRKQSVVDSYDVAKFLERLKVTKPASEPMKFENKILELSVRDE